MINPFVVTAVILSISRFSPKPESLEVVAAGINHISFKTRLFVCLCTCLSGVILKLKKWI